MRKKKNVVNLAIDSSKRKGRTAINETEEVVIDDTLPVDGDVIINGEDVVDPDVVDPMEGEPTE